ncbi:type II restriction endonuclease [Phaeodactylibacter luteus]|uniref:Restriction endonuclease n=1 Tax=Phaeodactylibacter luteus TaxID=1564516 RepID=A0A5C6RHZ8_9BACT|nr:type II restriction endonuclease [Phaeodactylibacter luteus]TXB62078.1 restriction endonuclease [Phaeodactylibacter luteus]
MSEILQSVIDVVSKAEYAFCKFISANDAGKTGAHQAGFYMPKSTIPLMFDSPQKRGTVVKREIEIIWQDDFKTESAFTYYGAKTRNEYRLTRFGKGFPFFEDENVGDLLILAKVGGDFYRGYVLSTDDEIEDFFSAFNISPTDTNKLINTNKQISERDWVLSCFQSYISGITSGEFPPTREIADMARICLSKGKSRVTGEVITKPDKIILKWLEYEFELFKAIENKFYSKIIERPFLSVEELVKTANSILNRRKSRAGKSLEHHLEKIFVASSLVFDAQARIDGNKKPDFLFPSKEKYEMSVKGDDSLTFLAAKTTCKDRWRQILNEAEKIPLKHLFTIQQGISKNQLAEMKKANVKLVVPKQYISFFPKEYQNELLNLKHFIGLVKGKQEL